MRKIIFICIILQLFYCKYLYHHIFSSLIFKNIKSLAIFFFFFNIVISRVESLIGSKITSGSYGEFSFIASIRTYPQRKNFCTGTLITKKHVITSKHCIVNKKPEQIRIVFEFVSLQEVAIAYEVASWVTYDSWADRLGIPKDQIDHNIATIEVS